MATHSSEPWVLTDDAHASPHSQTYRALAIWCLKKNAEHIKHFRALCANESSKSSVASNYQPRGDVKGGEFKNCVTPHMRMYLNFLMDDGSSQDKANRKLDTKMAGKVGKKLTTKPSVTNRTATRVQHIPFRHNEDITQTLNTYRNATIYTRQRLRKTNQKELRKAILSVRAGTVVEELPADAQRDCMSTESAQSTQPPTTQEYDCDEEEEIIMPAKSAKKLEPMKVRSRVKMSKKKLHSLLSAQPLLPKRLSRANSTFAKDTTASKKYFKPIIENTNKKRVSPSIVELNSDSLITDKNSISEQANNTLPYLMPRMFTLTETAVPTLATSAIMERVMGMGATNLNRFIDVKPVTIKTTGHDQIKMKHFASVDDSLLKQKNRHKQKQIMIDKVNGETRPPSSRVDQLDNVKTNVEASPTDLVRVDPLLKWEKNRHEQTQTFIDKLNRETRPSSNRNDRVDLVNRNVEASLSDLATGLLLKRDKNRDEQRQIYIDKFKREMGPLSCRAHRMDMVNSNIGASPRDFARIDLLLKLEKNRQEQRQILNDRDMRPPSTRADQINRNLEASTRDCRTSGTKCELPVINIPFDEKLAMTAPKHNSSTANKIISLYSRFKLRPNLDTW